MGPDVMAAEIFGEIVNAQGPDGVPVQTLASVKALAPPAREEVAAALETLLVSALHKTAWREQQSPMHTLGEMERRAIEAGRANRAILRGIHEALALIAEVRGAAAQPLTRAYVAVLEDVAAPRVQDYVEAAAKAWSRAAAEME